MKGKHILLAAALLGAGQIGAMEKDSQQQPSSQFTVGQVLQVGRYKEEIIAIDTAKSENGDNITWIKTRTTKYPDGGADHYYREDHLRSLLKR